MYLELRQKLGKLKKKKIEDIHVSCPRGAYDIDLETRFSIIIQLKNHGDTEIFLKKIEETQKCMT